MESSRQDMKRQGHQAFADELADFAAGVANDRVTAIAARLAEPLQVAVHGRPGVGCSTVARALGLAASHIEVTTVGSPDPSDVRVGDVSVGDVYLYVAAEVAKPEDCAAVAAARTPVLAVLNKADLLGFAGHGPIARARLRAKDCAVRLGVPTEPMVGLLGVAALDQLDETLWTAIDVLAAESAPLDAFHLDGFLAATHPLPAGVRSELLDTLDLFGTAIAVAAARRGRTRAQIGAILRQISGVDAVVSKIADLGAQVRYQRVLEAIAELEAFAVSDERISTFLTSDNALLARMACAEEVARASGLAGATDNACVDQHALLPRAVRWQRYSRGPVSALHRACGADITRGSLRLWSRAQNSHVDAPESL